VTSILQNVRWAPSAGLNGRQVKNMSGSYQTFDTRTGQSVSYHDTDWPVRVTSKSSPSIAQYAMTVVCITLHIPSSLRNFRDDFTSVHITKRKLKTCEIRNIPPPTPENKLPINTLLLL
jgi:hypothetical protein